MNRQLRFQHKNGLEDLKKARKNLDWLIDKKEEFEMDKSFLEKKIEEQARKEFEKEWNDFVAKMYNHPIFGKIRITIDGKEYPLAIFGVNNGIFNQNQDRNSRNQFFNFEKVKERVIQEKIESKTNDLIKQVASIGYLFE